MAMTEKQLANLRPWKPGQSGNPRNIRHRHDEFDDLLKKLGNKVGRYTDPMSKRRLMLSPLEVAARRLLRCAMDGAPWAVTLLSNRIGGIPKVRVEMTGDNPSIIALAQAVSIAFPALPGPEKEAEPE